ncbi:MAG: asparagine synthase (glutamine-hydrolyzing) [Planctomycetota bacterium]
MCGIGGIYWEGDPPQGPPPAVRVGRMLDAMAHRGPDSRGRASAPFAEVGFVRLSILDVANGTQPFETAGPEEGRASCFLNGEIFNHRRLRAGLAHDGACLETGSDAEVLPHLFTRHGGALFDHLEGMYTVCVLDRAGRRVLLGRDPVGIKQMYIYRGAGLVVFASEIKGLLASGLVPAEVDERRLLPLLTMFYVTGSGTLVRDVEQLLPGQVATVGPGATVEIRDAEPLIPEQCDGFSGDIASSIVRKALVDAVGGQLESDVPLGLSLSGGVDSSAIAIAAAEAGHRAMVTLTVSYPDTDQAEATSAQELASRLGFEHVLLSPDTGALARDLPMLGWLADAPVLDPALYSQYLIANAAREHVTVLLSGAGGDEVFGGYGSYFPSGAQQVLLGLPGPLRSLASVLVRNPKHRDLLRHAPSRYGLHAALMSSLGPSGRERVRGMLPGSADPYARLFSAFERHAGRDPAGQQMAADLETYLPEQVLPMADRASMAASVELRVPLLDVSLIRTGSPLNSEIKLGTPPAPKRLLRDAIADAVPAGFFDRPKTGLPNPMTGFVHAEWDGLVRSVLLAESAPLTGWFGAAWLSDLVATRDSAVRNYRVIGTLVALAAWHRWFVQLGRVDRPEIGTRELFEIPA